MVDADSTTVAMGSAHVQGLSRPQRRRLLLAAGVLAVLLLWPWLSLLTSAAYCYTWWALAPEIHWAPTPGEPAAAVDGDAAAGGGGGGGGVPKVIHQTWKDADIPQKWQKARQSCIDLHPDYEYKLWTDADGLQFITEHYPWFLPTYLSYPYAIQRVDVVRYFILHHHGGVYLDLDVGCLKRLDFMLHANFTAPNTNPVGISNDIMAAAPGAPYLGYALQRLRHWNRWMGIKYIQVMFSTGPMFLTVQYSMFPRRSGVAVVSRPVYGKYEQGPQAAFYHLHGSSWHANDAQFIFWMNRHKLMLAVLGVLAAAALAGTAVLRFTRQAARARALKLEE